ncbi:MAG: hypothetical protein E7668_00255 [Ruminococcaceae bacterium]|nr:hypothetical protein [Oscillospiraceae bacterium]
MKKVIALVVAVVLLAVGCMPIIYGAEEISDTDAFFETAPSPVQDETQNYVMLRENSVTYTCYYRSDSKKVEISGTINHDVMVTHTDHVIAVYKIAPGQTFEDVLNESETEALATTAITVKFQFSFQAETVSDRFASYAVALCSPDGEMLLAAEPQYPAVEANVSYSSEDRSGIKGIKTDMLSIGGGLQAGSAIVEISLEHLLSQTSSGYLYHVGESYQYFDKAYIDRLDASVRTYSASGCKVYLQFLFSDSETDAASERMLETVYSEDTLSLISAFSEFLVSRYDTYRNGEICGVIVGEKIDRIYEERYSSYSVRDYAERYAFLLTVIANSVRAYQSDLDIVLPFSDYNSYETQETSAKNSASPSVLLEMILQILEKRLSHSFSCSTLIESDASAQQIMQPFAEKASNTEAEALTIGVETVAVYSEYLSRLSERYENAPDHFMFVWEVPSDCRGNSLACAYTYSFYRLFAELRLSSFVVSFAEAEEMAQEPIADIEKIIRYIDTDKSLTVTENLLVYFGAEQWQEVLSLPSESALALRYFERAERFDLEALDWKGSFSYAEFPQGNMSGWYAGNFCGEIKSDYSKNGERILAASLQPQNKKEHAEVLYLYEYSENYVYTPYVAFDLSVNGGGASENALCEIVITMGNRENTVTAEYIVSVNQRTSLTLDLENYVNESMVDYIKIGCRMLSEEPTAFTLNLYDVIGYSTVYSSEDLNTLIEAERAKIRNQQELSDDGSDGASLTWIIFGVLLAVSAVGVGLFMFFRKTEEARQRDTEDEEDSDASDE